MPSDSLPENDSTANPATAGPMSRGAVIDRYLLEHRAKLLDLAAFLDRCDRSVAESDDEDFRLQAIRNAVALLTDGKPDRTRRILEQLSDLSTDLLDHAPGKGAIGVPYPPNPGS